MKHVTLPFLILLAHCNVSGQFARWEWAISQPSGPSNELRDAATDPYGCVYVTGKYTGAVTPWPGFTLTSAGSYDILLAKYTRDGQPVWAKSLGGAAYEEVYGIKTDGLGNVYVAGRFESAEFIADTFRLARQGGINGFLVKYDSAGAVIWARSMPASGITIPQKLAVDAEGNAWLTGAYAATNLSMGGVTLPNTNALGGMFVVKYLPDGVVAWASGMDGPGTDEGQAIATDKFGNVYVAGASNSQTLQFLNGPSLPSSGGFQIFLVKYGSGGGLQWVRLFGGKFSDRALGLATDTLGNVYMTGYSNSDTLTMDGITLTPGPSEQVFVARFHPDGQAVWLRQSTGGFGARASDIEVNANGMLAIGGYFTGPSFNLGPYSLLRAGGNNSDAFVAALDTSGAWLWATRGGGARDDRCLGLEIDSDGKVYAVGFWQGEEGYFGAHTLVNILNPLSYDAFLGRIGPATTSAGRRPDSFPLQAYPQPASGTVRVTLPDGARRITVYAMDGRQVLAKSIQAQYETEVSLTATGWFLLRVEGKNGSIWTTKVFNIGE